MKQIILILTILSLLFSGLFAVTTSTLLQSITVVLLGVTCILGSVAKIDIRVNRAVLALSITGLIYFIWRGWTSPVSDLGRGDLFLFLPAASIYFLYVFGCVNRKYWFWGIVSSVCLLGILNVLMFIDPLNTWRDNTFKFAVGDHQSGLYNHRNFCSNMLMMVVVLSLSVALWFTKVRWQRVMFFIIALVGMIGVFLASARGGFVAMVCALFVVVICYLVINDLSKKVRWVASILVIILTIGVGVGASSLLNERKSTLADSTQFSGRKYYFAMAIDQIPDAPLIGSGSMSYSYLSYENWGSLHQHKLDHVWVHNEFLQLTTDYGIIGLFTVTAFLFLGGCQFIRNTKDRITGEIALSSAYKLQLVGGALIIGFIVNTFVSFPAHSQPNLLVFAFACSLIVMTLGKALRGRFYEIVARMILVLIGIMSLFIGSKEVRALKAFSEQGIYVDNANWVSSDHLNDGWFKALENVVEDSPTYLRLERLSALLQDRSDLAVDENKKREMVELALKYSRESIKRHPYSAVSIAHMANNLFRLEKYREALEWYKRLAKLTKSRESFFLGYNKQAMCEVMLARTLLEDNKIDESLIMYRNAYNSFFKSRYRRDIESLKLMTMISTERASLLIENSSYSGELETFWAQFYNKQFLRYRNQHDLSSVILEHARALANYADKKFMGRQPEIALKWFIRASRYYNEVDSELLSDDELNKTNTQIQLVKKRIKLLKNAKIKPAK